MLLTLMSVIIAIIIIKISIDLVEEVEYLPFFPPLFILGAFIGLIGIVFGIFG